MPAPRSESRGGWSDTTAAREAHGRSGTRYRSGIFWDDSTGRIGISSNVSVINNEFGSNATDPVIDTTSVVYAPLVLSELWVSDCAGESVTITCADSERTLENISIDGGFY